MQSVAFRYLLLADALFVLGGLLAYAARPSLALMTAVSLVMAVAGLWYMRLQAEGAVRLDIDRALSYAAGAWAVLIVLIVLPYITIEDGEPLWNSIGYAALGLFVASMGVMLWNVMALRALQPDTPFRTLRMYVLFHAFVALLAIWVVLQGDGQTVEYELRGVMVTGHDLQVAPALAAVPGVVWFLALARAKPSE